MELSITAQALVFFFSCAVGFFLGAVYDIFRIIRIAFNSKFLSVFFQDFIFCIFSAVCIILLVYYTNSGTVRWFALFGCFLCFVIYNLTVGKIVMFMAKKIIELIKRLINFILSITIIPAKKLIIFTAKSLKKLAINLFLWIKKTKQEVKENNKQNKIRNKAERKLKNQAARGFDLYEHVKVPKSISKIVVFEIKKNGNKPVEKKIENKNQKKIMYKSRGNKSASLGSISSLSSIEFK